MATVIVSFDTTTQNFPSGTVVNGYSVSITGGPAGTAIPSQSVQASPATFSGVPTEASTDPDYVASVQLLDTSGAALGAPVSASFSVLSPPVVGNVPNTVTVQVTP